MTRIEKSIELINPFGRTVRVAIHRKNTLLAQGFREAPVAAAPAAAPAENSGEFREELEGMTKDELVEFAMETFELTLDAKQKKSQLIDAIIEADNQAA